jgi:hypothetical protein
VALRAIGKLRSGEPKLSLSDGSTIEFQSQFHESAAVPTRRSSSRRGGGCNGAERAGFLLLDRSRSGTASSTRRSASAWLEPDAGFLDSDAYGAIARCENGSLQSGSLEGAIIENPTLVPRSQGQGAVLRTSRALNP